MDDSLHPENSFENLAESIVRYLLRDIDASITRTRPTKDGGYDIIVEYNNGAIKQNAYFECKLRNGNLGLRDIAANVIIAFNHGAIAMVAITNHDFTQQTGEELIEFFNHTVLNIKIIAGDDIQWLLTNCGADISDELRKYLSVKKARRQDNFSALRIDFQQGIVEQIFSKHAKPVIIPNDWTCQIFTDEIRGIGRAVNTARLVIVSGYLGVGKASIIENALTGINKQVIYIDPTLRITKELVILDILAQVWGVPAYDLFSCFTEEDIAAIIEVVGNEKTSKETGEILTSLLNTEYAERRTSARYNVLISDYIIRLLSLHNNDIGYVLYISNMQFASKEIYDFLSYFVTFAVKSSIPCILSYQIPEFEIQSGYDPREHFQYMKEYIEYNITPPTSENACQFIRKLYPELSEHLAKLIVAKVGTRFYSLSLLINELVKGIPISPISSKQITDRLQAISPNNISNHLAVVLPWYQNRYRSLFETCYLLKCRVPMDLCIQLEYTPVDLDVLVNAGVFKQVQGIIVPHNEIVRDWIMSAYTDSSPSIQIRARELLNYIKTNYSDYCIELIGLYCVLGFSCEALALIDQDIPRLKKEKQYTLLRRELEMAIQMAKYIHNVSKEASYIICLLEIIAIQKAIESREAQKLLDQLDQCRRNPSVPDYCNVALTYFTLERAFKMGTYLTDSSKCINIGKDYYQNCIDGTYVTNTGDWLGKLCSCYALMIKETQGNAAALDVFTKVLQVLPSSFELRREYYSHLACIQLFNCPLSAFSNYKKILEMFRDEAPESAALPFHEYGDLAMSQLIAGNYTYAYELVNDAIEISRANGIIDEEGRCLNILGCVEWCLGELHSAQNNFREATSIMIHSGYIHYAWRSQINLLQLSFTLGDYADTREVMFNELYSLYKSLLSKKIRNLAQLDRDTFRTTREYHALLAIGILWTKLFPKDAMCRQICIDFKLGKHKSQFKHDVSNILSGNLDNIYSPYIKEGGNIYIVG